MDPPVYNKSWFKLPWLILIMETVENNHTADIIMIVWSDIAACCFGDVFLYTLSIFNTYLKLDIITYHTLFDGFQSNYSCRNWTQCR